MRGPLGLDDPVLGSDAPGLEPLLQGPHGVRLVAAPAHRVWFFSSQFGVVAVIGWSVGRHPGPAGVKVMKCPPSSLCISLLSLLT